MMHTPEPSDTARLAAPTTSQRQTITSESVSEGHPDNVGDDIANAIVDAHNAGDPHSRVACEVLCKRHLVVIAGDISSRVEIEYEPLVHDAIRDIGYTGVGEPFCADTIQLLLALTKQSHEIGAAVDRDTVTLR